MGAGHRHCPKLRLETVKQLEQNLRISRTAISLRASVGVPAYLQVSVCCAGICAHDSALAIQRYLIRICAAADRLFLAV